MLEKVFFQKLGVKNAVYGSKCPSKQKPALLGLVSKAVANRSILQDALKSIGAFEAEVKMRTCVLFIMATELLFGSGVIRGGGAVKRFLAEKLDEMKAVVGKSGKTVQTSPEIGKPALPRYLRVNGNRFRNVEEAIARLRKSGIEGVSKDAHVPNVLVVDAKQTKNIVILDEVKRGDILLQDKSTCVTAYALLGKRGKGASAPIHVVDACAAPGGKTLHILENLRPGDSLTAVELDPKRAKILEERLATLGDVKKGVKVTVVNSDFLKLFEEDARLGSSPITHINLDPSCSGSGMEGPSTKGKDKLQTLASFQAMMLRHALNAFPKAKVVCYSTCSVLPIENEEVVNANLNHGFDVDQTPLPEWWTSNREEMEDGFIRTSPEKDNCRGFFLAKLVRA